MSTGIKSRYELIKEIAQALQEHFEGFIAFNYVDVTNNQIGFSTDDIGPNDEFFPKDGEAIVRIEPLPSRESFGCMEDFADQVDKQAKARNAVSCPQPSTSILKLQICR